MTETRKTLIFAGAAGLLALGAWATAPTLHAPDAFFDRGETFFPDFTDPNVARTLEVIAFDEATASASPFKVTFNGGRWTIPSHHDYPADGEERLAATAAGVIDIVKDDFRTDNVADHEACGVIDPLDDTATSLVGRGKRITIKGEGNTVLADLIVGKQPEGRDAYRFVRIPGQKRVYVSKIDADVSARFEDWIEQDLLRIEPDEVERVVLDDYRIDERTLRIQRNDTVELDKSAGAWALDTTPEGREIDTTKINALVRAIDELNIVGVRPKPAGLSAGLRNDGGLQVRQGELASLQQKGYYLTRDGALMSNEGEVRVQTGDGIVYTLRFGEVLFGRGDTVSAGTAPAESGDDSVGPGENRYLFITAEFRPELLPAPPAPANRDFENMADTEWSDDDRSNSALALAWDEWQNTTALAQTRAEALRDRFADWYYVISSESFDGIHLGRNDLTKEQSS